MTKITDIHFDHGPGALQWKDLPFDDRPSGPEQEFFFHGRRIKKAHLLYEWQGLDMEHRIEQLYRDPERLNELHDLAQPLLVGGLLQLDNLDRHDAIQWLLLLDYQGAHWRLARLESALNAVKVAKETFPVLPLAPDYEARAWKRAKGGRAAKNQHEVDHADRIAEMKAQIKDLEAKIKQTQCQLAGLKIKIETFIDK